MKHLYEEWRNIYGFPGYQVSNLGEVRSFWKKKHCPTGYGTFRYLSDSPYLMSQSDDGNGYMKVCLYSEDGKRYCKKVHKLVADAFIPVPDECEDYTVDHIKSGPEGKLDNSVNNLRWLTRAENIKKAYFDGCCDERIQRQKKMIRAIDLWTGDETFYRSIGEASYDLDIDRSLISHVLIGDMEKTNHYTFDYICGKDRLLYGSEEEYY